MTRRTKLLTNRPTDLNLTEQVTWLIWLESFNKKWISQYNRNGLANQIWQMKSAPS